MPNIQSAIRRVKKTKVQTSVNRIRKSKYKAAVKKMTGYISSGKIDDARKFIPEFHSQLMKVSKTGAVDRKTASRKISRLVKKIQNFKKTK